MCVCCTIESHKIDTSRTSMPLSEPSSPLFPSYDHAIINLFSESIVDRSIDQSVVQVVLKEQYLMDFHDLPTRHTSNLPIGNGPPSKALIIKPTTIV